MPDSFLQFVLFVSAARDLQARRRRSEKLAKHEPGFDDITHKHPCGTCRRVDVTTRVCWRLFPGRVSFFFFCPKVPHDVKFTFAVFSKQTRMFEVGLWAATTTRPTESREDATKVSGGDPLLRPAASWRTDQCETFDALIICTLLPVRVGVSRELTTHLNQTK